MKKYWVYQRVWKNLNNNNIVVDIFLYDKCCKDIPRPYWSNHFIKFISSKDNDWKINWMHYDLVDTVWREVKGGESYEC